MSDVPKPPASQAERGRVAVRGKRTDDATMTTLLVVHEFDGSWTFHGLGAPGIRLPRADAIEVAQAVLAAAR